MDKRFLPKSAEVREKMSLAHLGKPHPNKGHRNSLATRIKMSRAHLGKKLSAETRLKMIASAKRGVENNMWRGGVWEQNDKIRHSVEMKEWRNKVFERDEYTCQECGQVGGELEAHHIKAFSRFPELRFDTDNGRTLCKPCHRKTDTYLGRARLNTVIIN